MFIEYVPGTSLKTLHMFLHFILTRSFLLWYSPTCLFLLSLLVLWVLLFSRSVLSVFLQLQNARLPCPSLSPRVCSNSCPLSRWGHPTISSSPSLLFCLQPFPASGSFLVSWLSAACGQSIGVSASASILPMNIQYWFPLRLTGLIFLQSKGLSRVFSSTTVHRHYSLALSLLYSPTLTSIHDYWKNHSFNSKTFVGQSDVSAI